MLREALQRLSKHSLTYAAAEQASRLAGFLLIPLFTHYLTEEQYGQKELFTVTLAVLAQIGGINLTQAMARHYFDGATPQERRIVVSTTWISVAVLAGTLALLCVAGSFALQGREPLPTPELGHLFRLSLGILWFQMLREVLGRYLQTAQRSTAFGVFSFSKLLLELGLQITFVAYLGRGLLGAFEAVLLSEALAATALSIALLPGTRLRFSRAIFAGLLAFSLPLIPNGILQFCLHSADRYLLGWLTNAEEVGVYGLAYKLGYIGNYVLLSPFLLIWYPYVFSLANRERQREVISEVAPFLLFALTAVTLVVSLAARELVELLASRPGFQRAAAAIPWVALGYWFWGWFQLAQTGFYVEKRTSLLPGLTLVGVVLNVAANLLLIPRLGFLGAAIATAATFLALAVITQRAVQRVLPHPLRVRRIFVPLGAALAVYLCAEFFAPKLGAGAWIAKSALLGAWLLWAWWGFLRPHERRALLSAVGFAPRAPDRR